jgi:hypothetical protein
VLRVANALGEQLERPFVIAIDGIDHAARAGSQIDSFLGSLVAPDQVPPNVVFLIGGQPPDAYPQYPMWLRAPTPGVTRFDLPRLILEDTQQLAAARLPLAPAVEVVNAAREIWQRCAGHTLSTVFAIEEAALMAEDLSRLGDRLDSRHIASGVEAYYALIWSAATNHFSVSATPIRLAACLCLMPVRADADTVRAALVADEVDAVRSEDFLRQLRPLVVEDGNGFRVFHNDVRIFLNRLLQADAAVYRDCASRLADHLMAKGDARARHSAVQNLLGIALRRSDQAALFTPTYVMEGHAIGCSLDELTDQGLISAAALADVEPNWSLAHNVATGLRTLQQLRATLEWRSDDGSEHRPSTGPVATRSAERSVPPLADWNDDIVRAALDDILELNGRGEAARAVGAFRRWFGGLTPAEVARASNEASSRDAENVDRDSSFDVIRKLGRAASATRVLPPRSSGTTSDHAEAHFATGLLTDLGDTLRSRDFVLALRRVQRYFAGDVEQLLRQLIDTRSWKRCEYVLRTRGAHDGTSRSFQLTVAAAASLVGRSAMRESLVAPLLANRAATINGATSVTDGIGEASQRITMMAYAALIFGLEEPARDASGIREEIEQVYRKQQRDDRHDVAVSQVLHAAALLGSLARTTREAQPRALHVQATRVARVVKTLIATAHSGGYAQPFGFSSAAARLVSGFVDCSAQDPDLRDAIAQELEEQLRSEGFLNEFLEIAWRHLVRANRVGALVTYADLWVGPAGRAWNEAAADRHDIAIRVARLLQEVGEHERARAIRERLLWSDISYVGRKEYVLRQPIDWFEALAINSPFAWADDGLRLLAISREASRVGENRFGSQVEDAVLTAACISGPRSISQIARAPNGVLAKGTRGLISALTRMTKTAPVSRDDLIAIWSLCTGQLSWQIEMDRHHLADVRAELVAAAARADLADVATKMELAAPAEYACEPERANAASAYGRDYSALAGQSIAAAMRDMCNEQDWLGIGIVVERIANENAPDAADAISRAWATLALRAQRMWSYDGADRLFTAIFPLLSPAERWQGVQRSIALNVDSVPEYRAATLAESLDDLCRLAAIEHGPGAVREGLRRLLTMHEVWIGGNGRLPALSPIGIAADDSSVTSWGTVVVDILFQSLGRDEQSYVQAALRGLDRVTANDPRLFERVATHAQSAEPAIKRRLLFVAEAFARRQDAKPFREWLTTETMSPRLDIGLSAWSALRFGARALGESEPTWEESVVERPRVTTVARPMLIRPADSKGLLSIVGRASTTVLDRLAEACGDDLADVRSEFAASMRDDPPPLRPHVTRERSVGDMLLSGESDAEMDRLFTVLRRFERRGRFGAPIARLAQAIVPFVDPFVFLRTPRQCSSVDKWPIDDRLDSLMLAAPGESLERVTETDLDASACMIAATVRTYSRKWDVSLSVDHVVLSDVSEDEDQRVSVLNGRASLSSENSVELMTREGGAGQTWLTSDVGGLLPLIDATLDFFPSKIWRGVMGWEPDAHDPLTWKREGIRVAWFERLQGPVRRIYPGDLAYRQPILTRWVCIEDEWRRMAELVGRPERRVRARSAKLDPPSRVIC